MTLCVPNYGFVSVSYSNSKCWPYLGFLWPGEEGNNAEVGKFGFYAVDCFSRLKAAIINKLINELSFLCHLHAFLMNSTAHTYTLQTIITME